MPRLTAAKTQTIAAALRATSPGRERSALVAAFARDYSVTKQAIYKAAERAGFESGRARRADAEIRRIPVSDEQLKTVVRIMHFTHTEKRRIPLAAWHAIQIAEDSDLIPRGVLTEERLNTWMRDNKVSKADALRREPHANLMTLHPNYCHVVDASQCAQWYLDGSGHVRHQRRDFDVYSNKPGKPGKITRLLLVDHYTGALFPWYTYSDATLDLVEFLYFAWAPKSFLHSRVGKILNLSPEDMDAYFPFRGVPKFIYSDRGASLVSGVVKQVLTNLEITHLVHLPGNPKAKGSNEGMQRHWENWFESGLKLESATTLEQLNAWAFDRACQINSRLKHSRTQATRFELWTRKMTENAELLREIPSYEFFRSYATAEPETRVVGYDRLIKFRPRGIKTAVEHSGVYRLDAPDLAGTTVEVRYSLYDYPQILVTSRKTNRTYTLDPILRDAESGFYPEISAVIGETYRMPALTESERALNNIGAPAPQGTRRARVQSNSSIPSISSMASIPSTEQPFDDVPGILPIHADAPAQSIPADAPAPRSAGTPSNKPAPLPPLNVHMTGIARAATFPAVTGTPIHPIQPETPQYTNRLDAKLFILRELGLNADELTPLQRTLLPTADVQTNTLRQLVAHIRDAATADPEPISQGGNIA